MLCPLCQEGFPQDIVIQGFIMGLYDDDDGDDAEHALVSVLLLL